MAKVGSSAIVEELTRHHLPVFHVHRMNPEHVTALREQRRRLGWEVGPIPPNDELGMRLNRDILQRGRTAKIVTIVREPIARNLSSYFEHLDAIWHTRDAHESIPIGDLCRGFLERFTHSEPLTWFDDELRPVTGVDVYAHPFPDERVIRTERIAVLILKAEDGNEAKSAALSDFLGVDIVVRRSNETRSKSKGDAFLRFRQALRLSREYVEEMSGARYTRHFYSASERQQFARLYLGDDR